MFATCYDSEEALLSKYHGHAEKNIKHFLAESEDQDNAENVDEDSDSHTNKKSQAKLPARKVMYSVDARKLGSNTGGGKDIRKGIPAKKHRNSQPYHRNGGQQLERRNHDDDGGPWDMISFNFPHVGGLSTDVNRQVRANQEVLVAFFKACVPLLSKISRKEDGQNNVDDDYNDYSFGSETSESESEEEEEENQDKIRSVPRQSGQIIVTIFEGEPYTLWNIKDLARHAGLVVVTSFKFPWKSYPGYSHARTLGIVESGGGKAGDEDESKRGGWKGEDREARSYVFEVKSESGQQRRKGQQQKNRDDGKGNMKRGRGDDSSDED